VHNLVHGPLEERRVDGDDRAHPARGKPACERYHVAFGYADVEETIREARGKRRKPRSIAHRRRQRHDAVVFLRFPDELVEAYGLTPGMRLVTSTGYERLKDKVAPDIFPGSDFSGLYGDFIPIVQLFLAGKKQILFSGGDQEIRERPGIFSEEIWQKVEKKTAEYAGRGLCRDGFFFVKEK
jgi:hypothetical protein